MKTEEFGHAPFPRGPLVGAAALVGLTLLAVAMARLAGPTTSPVTPMAAIEVRDLRFEDRSDGGVTVYDTNRNKVVEVLAPGTNGFLRATLRGLARDRKRQGIGAEAPFRLTWQTTGRLTLDDPATGRHVDLGAFGPTNAGAFARLLTADRGAR